MSHKEEIRELIDKITKQSLAVIEKDNVKYAGYYINKKVIKNIFDLTKDISPDYILARLTVLDSMYSTQMNKRYYALDALKFAISPFYDPKSFKTFSERLIEFCNKFEDEDILKLFNGKYGIGKDGNEKGKAVSLISKYAYYETDFNFPIYDSIVRERFAGFWKYCDFEKNELPPIILNSMTSFINAINNLLTKLDYIGNNKPYDALDYLLWRLGKIIRGNLSLVLKKEDYKDLMDKIKAKRGEEGKFTFPEDKKILIDIVNKEDNDENEISINEKEILIKIIELAEKLVSNNY